MTTENLRWQYRFINFQRAYNLLRNAMEERNERELSDLEEEGVIQRFEYTWELTWKTLKDYLENDGVVLEKITPKSVIIAAIEAKLIDNHEQWMRALDHRNKMNHTYNHVVFSEVIANIEKSYLLLFDTLYEKLLHEIIITPKE